MCPMRNYVHRLHSMVGYDQPQANYPALTSWPRVTVSSPTAFRGGALMPARSICLVTLSLPEAGPGRFGRQQSSTDFYHAMLHW